MLCALSPAQGQTAQEANRKLSEGAAAYKAGDFAEAQRHFEKALELDLSSKNAPLFIARAIHAQYRPGIDTPENVQKAQAAIGAYKKVLERNADDDNSYNSVAYLYRQLKDEEKETEWLMMRANSETAPKEKRSDAYTVLASKQWNYSYDITEQPANKVAIDKPGAIVGQFKKPKDESDFYKAQQCATRGMELVEQAISLNPQNPSAWSYKTNLLREMAKFAEMEGNADQKAHYTKSADEAEASQTKLNRAGALSNQEEKAQLCAAAESNTSPSESNEGNGAESASAGKEVIGRGGVLNGKAISKPAPPYPAEAKEARASGTVTIAIVIDESGKVFSARPVGGHPLLWQASVNAACKAQFSPTTLSGQPVKVSGVITYNFVLQ
ncbi:MAG TPA: TonB family protein [Pyrinomonadaceae bacterium]|nr:TonB family protein [Pyrinomonadaceae bacterium]